MHYSEYIKLGFRREDMNDSVEFEQTGYRGFYLEKTVSKKMYIGVSSGELDTPKLYIKKQGQDSSCHIIPITSECVIDLCNKD